MMKQTTTPAANPITDGIIWKEILRYFFPLLFGTLFQQLYNTVDAVIVGRYVGKVALSAVGGTSAQMVSLLVGFFLGLSSGASVVVAQFYGAKRGNEVSRAVHTGVSLSLLAGIIISVAGFLLAKPFAQLLNTPEEVLDGTVLYLHIIFAGMIPNLFYNIGSSILRAVGDSKRPLYYLIASCLSNIILDLLFVISLHMGVAGVAIATVLSQLFSALLVLRALLTTDDSYQLTLSKVRFHKDMLRRMLSIGIPGGIQSAMYMISNVVIQASINGFGTDVMAAWTATSKADVLVWLVFGAFGTTVTTFVGQNYGAGNMERVRTSIRTSLWMTTATILALCALILLFGRYLLYLFSTDSAVIEIGTHMIGYFARFYWTFILVEIVAGALRGMGEVLVPTILDLLGVCALRIAWLTLYLPSHHTVDTVMWSYPISWGITSVLFVAYYFYFTMRRHLFDGR